MSGQGLEPFKAWRWGLPPLTHGCAFCRRIMVALCGDDEDSAVERSWFRVATSIGACPAHQQEGNPGVKVLPDDHHAWNGTLADEPT